MATASPNTPVTEYGVARELPQTATASRASDSGLPLALFLITIATTCMMGARFAANFAMGLPPIARPGDMFPLEWILQQPSRLVEGIPYAFTILSILLAHELGHYYACQRHGVEASLPFFLPAPTLSGTAGAVIRLRSRVPHRLALIDIGVSGPLWGFLVALPLTFLGLLLSARTSAGGPFIASIPPVFAMLNWVVQWMRPGWPGADHLLFHPVLLACWIGMFVTFLNLLPAGQLDGGHVLYGVFPRAHRHVTHALILVLIVAGVTLWMGWLFWAVMLMLPVMRHPRVRVEPPVEGSTEWLAALALALLLLTFMPMPFAHSSLQAFLH